MSQSSVRVRVIPGRHIKKSQKRMRKFAEVMNASVDREAFTRFTAEMQKIDTQCKRIAAIFGKNQDKE